MCRGLGRSRGQRRARRRRRVSKLGEKDGRIAAAGRTESLGGAGEFAGSSRFVVAALRNAEDQGLGFAPAKERREGACALDRCVSYVRAGLLRAELLAAKAVAAREASGAELALERGAARSLSDLICCYVQTTNLVHFQPSSSLLKRYSFNFFDFM